MYSRTRCRVEASHCARFRLFAEVSSGPLFCHPQARTSTSRKSFRIIKTEVPYHNPDNPNKKTASEPIASARFLASERQFSKCRCRSVSKQWPRARRQLIRQPYLYTAIYTATYLYGNLSIRQLIMTGARRVIPSKPPCFLGFHFKSRSRSRESSVRRYACMGTCHAITAALSPIVVRPCVAIQI
jgi:hypothetical protein